MRIVPFLASLALAFSACMTGAFAAPSQRQVYDVAPSTNVGISTSGSFNGSIDLRIVAWPNSTIVLQRTVRGVDPNNVLTKVQQYGKTFSIDTTYRGEPPRVGGVLGWFGLRNWSGIHVRYEMHVPENASIALDSVNGDATIDGIRGGIAGSNSNGDLILRGVAGAIDVCTSNGDIVASLLTVAPTVHLCSSNGDVTLTVPARFDGSVRASTSNGDITNPFSNGRGGQIITLHTSNGDVTVKTANR